VWQFFDGGDEKAPALCQSTRTHPSATSFPSCCRWLVQDALKVATYWVVLKYDIFQVRYNPPGMQHSTSTGAAWLLRRHTPPALARAACLASCFGTHIHRPLPTHQ
jgi:hypothetical protein